MPVKEIIGNEESNTVDQVQSNEFNFTKMSNTAENKEKKAGNLLLLCFYNFLFV